MIHTYTSRNEKSLYRYYVCSKAQHNGWHSCPTKSVPAAEIEQFVIDRISCIGKDHGLIEETFNQAQQLVQSEISKLEDEFRIVQHELTMLGAEVPNLVNGSARSKPNRMNQSSGNVDLEDRIRYFRQKADELNAEITAKRNQRIDESEIISAMGKFDPIWDALSIKERTKMIHLLIDQVAYNGAEGKLSITFSPSGIKTLGQQATVNPLLIN